MAYALINNTKGQANDTFSTSPGIDTSGASLLVMVAHSDQTTITPSDSNTNTWLQAVQESTVNVATIYYSYYKGAPGTPIDVGSGHTFTLTGTDHFGTIQCYAFSGALTSSTPLDQTNNNISFGSTTGQPGSVTPTDNGQLIVTGDNHDKASATIDGSYTSPAGANTGYGDGQSLGVAMGGHSAYLIQGAAAATNPTWTANASANHYMVIATFKADPGAPPPAATISVRPRFWHPIIRPAAFKPGNSK